MVIACKTCSKSFSVPDKGWGSNRVYCSKVCQKSFLYGEGSPFKHLSSGTTGALAELLVSCDLMKKGFEVYRALSPASSCDVLALKDGNFFRFEIRTGYKSKDGNRITTNRKNIRADYLAVVIHKPFEIIYEPEF